MKREVGPKWGYFSMLWTTGLAYALSVFVYQTLTITIHPNQSIAWMGGIIILFSLTFYLMNLAAKKA